jgi:hypothetical protein
MTTAQLQRAKAGRKLLLVIDLDERGSFIGHVENADGKTVFAFTNEDIETGWPSEDGFWLVEDGFMRHKHDTEGLLKYLVSMGLANCDDTLSMRD